MGLGKNLKELIALKGMNINELAVKSGVSPQTLYAIIKRDNNKIDTQILMKIANALSVSVTDLIYIPSEEPDGPDGVSPEHPIAFPGLEKKLSEIGYHIKYGCDYAEYNDNDIWIEYPDGKKLFVSLTELENLNLETDTYLKFRVDQLRG